MKKAGIILLAALSLGGCAHKPAIPADYWGPQAKISDSYTSQGKTHADFFYLDKINGEKVADSREASVRNSFGRGREFSAQAFDRDVPARKAVFHVVGRTQYAAPIDQFLHTILEIQADIEFSPQPNHGYTVKGHLFDNGNDDSYTALWIADDQTGEPVTPKVEIEGAPSLGFFQKLVR